MGAIVPKALISEGGGVDSALTHNSFQEEGGRSAGRIGQLLLYMTFWGGKDINNSISFTRNT